MKLAATLLFAGAILVPHSQSCAQTQASAPDGWTTVEPGSAGLDPAALSRMEQAVASGEFQKITSIVISRHGKLAYERYFEGDASTLRDTRSATKTITSMVTGIAIDQRALPGLDA